MTWQIEFDATALRELKKLDKQNAERILIFLQKRVVVLEDPRSIGEALKGPELGGFWKYRVGDYRVICAIEDKLLRIIIIRIGNRREVYR